jgi:hypothetical protein
MNLIPILPYLLIAATLVSSLGLFLALKREIRQHIFGQKSRIEAMMERLDEADRPNPVEAPVPAPVRAGLNLNSRVHAMRMLRRGEDVGYIAAALGVPRREIELLIRVQSIGKARAMLAGTEQG